VHWSARSSFSDQATLLSKALGMEVRFAPIYRVPSHEHATPAREFGVAVLSRFPVLALRNHPLMRLSTQDAGAQPSPAPGFLEARIDVRGTPVRVFNTHLDYRANPAVRAVQVAEMLAIIGESPVATLLLGDLNATPDAGELRPLFVRLRDLWPPSSGPGLTYPAVAPAKRIDYLLGSPGITATDVRVVESDASDHRGVVADVTVRRGSR